MQRTTVALGFLIFVVGWSASSVWHGLSDQATESIDKPIQAFPVWSHIADQNPPTILNATNASLRRLFSSNNYRVLETLPSFATVTTSKSTLTEKSSQAPYKLVTSVSPPRIALEPKTRSHLKSFHESTLIEFEQAPGNGRSRGGAHVLIGDGAVKFLTDALSIDTTGASTSVSPYRLWGALGTRDDTEQLSEPKRVASPDISFNQHVRSLAIESQNTIRFGFDYLTPYFSDPESQPIVMNEIQLVSVELNRVYLIDQNMTYLPDLAKDTPFRELDQFETDALRQLADGKEVVTARISDEYRMLGALRNTETCIECHNGDPSLLGAFTYRFRD